MTIGERFAEPGVSLRTVRFALRFIDPVGVDAGEDPEFAINGVQRFDIEVSVVLLHGLL